MNCEVSEKSALFATSLKPAAGHPNKIMEIWFFRSKSWMDVGALGRAGSVSDLPKSQPEKHEATKTHNIKRECFGRSL